MATIPDVGPVWWDRDIDDQGHPIRSDVRQAAHELWPQVVKRVRRVLSDAAEAAELIEMSVVHISRHLNRTNVPAFAAGIPSLLSLRFSQELRRLARKLGKIELVGDNSSIEASAVVHDWADRINRHLDFEAIIDYLLPLSRTLVVMRLEQHSWSLIGAKLGRSPATLRKALWKDLREVLSRMSKRKRLPKKRIAQIDSGIIKAKLPGLGLPPDAERGEAEIINGFYRWVHRNRSNPQRIGCPGKLALAELVVADAKFDDKYTLKHIGECANCVDELTELRLEFERMAKNLETHVCPVSS